MPKKFGYGQGARAHRRLRRKAQRGTIGPKQQQRLDTMRAKRQAGNQGPQPNMAQPNPSVGAPPPGLAAGADVAGGMLGSAMDNLKPGQGMPGYGIDPGYMGDPEQFESQFPGLYDNLVNNSQVDPGRYPQYQPNPMMQYQPYQPQQQSPWQQWGQQLYGQQQWGQPNYYNQQPQQYWR